jgi:UDP-glucose 4-epimerase
MRILVTGGAGYIGSITVEVLVAAGHQVVVLDRLTTGHAAAVPAQVRLEVGSYGDTDRVRALLVDAEIEAVLHCGARSLVPESMADPALYYRENVVGGVGLLEACRLAGVQRFVFSSTAAVYGIPDTTPIAEDAPLRPINPYGETKRTLEAALFWYRSYGLRSVVLRYFNAAGASAERGEDHRPETHLIPSILIAALEGRPFTLFGDDYPTPDGTAIRDFIHVLDLADAHLRALEATSPDDPRTDEPLILNLGTGTGFSVRQVLAAAEAVVGRPIPVEVGPRRPGDPAILVASPRRAAQILGWEPRRSQLEAIVASAWAWHRRHPRGYEDGEGATKG